MLSIFRQIKKQFRELDRKLEITKKNQMDILELKNSVGSFKSRLHIAKQRTSKLENQMKIHRKKHGGERMEKQETVRDRRNVVRSLHTLKTRILGEEN